MPGKSPTLYDLNKTTIWFAVSSIILFVCLFVMIFQDSDREWKHYQREFVELSRQKAEGELTLASGAVNQNQLTEAKNRMKAAEDSRSAKQAEAATLQKELAKIQLDFNNAKAAFQDFKQFQDSDRYYYEEYHHKGNEKQAAHYKKKLDAREMKIAEAKSKMEGLETQLESKNAQIKQFSADVETADREIRKLNAEVIRLEGKIEKLTPKWYTALLNAPMLDFIRPSLQVQQIVVPKLEDDFYFAKSQKVDRCITCHLGIDQKAFGDAKQPFKAHPRLDLFLSSDSPHPMEEFGCTSCHGGGGHSVSFYTAAHTPQNEEQAKKWEKEHHWHPMKHWSDKMLPLNHTEAACAKCHTGTTEVPQAPKLNEGRQLAATFGCTGCHKVEGMERWKAGPDLRTVQSKLDQDWIVRWLQNPKEFRPSTHMPRVFHLSNTSDAESKELSNAAIAGIASYLIKNSDPVSLNAAPASGDAKNGEKLVGELGCLGCHSGAGKTVNNFGPELIGMGSKVKAEWLFTWLKNPKHYSPETRMPDMRLSDEEAADITAYLLTLRNEKFETSALPRVEDKVVDDLALRFLTGKMRKSEAQAELGKMSVDEKLEYVGKQSISHQGCFGCHTIKGFEDAKPIGTELTHEGSKEVDKLDFGFIKINKTRQDWFFQKLKEPRIFDEGRVKTYHEKLRMPQFDMSDKEAESLTTFILSLQKTDIPMDIKKNLTDQEKKAEKGRLLVSEFNCAGCHSIDGKEGKIREIYEDKGNAPPIILGQGKKVQDQWFYHFLQKPTTIRPWLKIRMPTFGFNDQQINDFIHYFHALDGVEPKIAPERPAPSPETVAAGRELFEKLQCIKCHKSNPEPGMSASFLAPDLLLSQHRLKADWVVDWIKDPATIMPGTMMPGFFPDGESPIQNILEGNASKQMEALRDYLWQFTPEEAAQAQAKLQKPAATPAAAGTKAA